MDGGHDFDPGSAGANTPINPNMDMISELTVLSSSFSAEYEHGPVVVNVETKGAAAASIMGRFILCPEFGTECC